MRNVYIVTHPEATHHVENIVGGWHDSTLTPRGVEDARRVAASLRNLLPDYLPGDNGGTMLFSSDLRRTRQTAETISGLLDLEIIFDPDLREQSYGAAEGTPAGSVSHLPPPAQGNRMQHQDGVEGSETRHVWAGRVYSALDRILAAGARDTIVVTHGGSATYLIAAWIRLPLTAAGYVKFRLSPGSITHLNEDNFYHDRRVLDLNLTGHLGIPEPRA
ncbi:histidine phosphatase family protein [Arthrobacter gengyunqii]|uniref:Histidine phosphatase family protein n=1 Tax=Arthrobacter gengyunqii TaxID=2886940 RepID=A0A9X1M4H3_9MICC|nr:histidine phosphatase family protein [Arthrobacter gengyunqii]MCC3270442.1 histidine phosphatase family protein [Arthrobacter gengyunqii]UOY97630.1 histidine phosphatase family protein [Arthrobacter gengyunqii]